MNNSLNSSILELKSWPELQNVLKLENILLTPLLALLIITTILGNLLVLMSGIIERTLRTGSNCLILSLAITDLMVGIIVMPLRSSIVLFGYWPFKFRCDLLFELKILITQSSVLHLVAIAIDRYIIVSNIRNPNLCLYSRTKARIGLMLTLVWAIPTLYVNAQFMGWHDQDWRTKNEKHNCSDNRSISYRVVGALITFYIPVPVIIMFYFLIYKTAKKSTRLKCRHNILYQQHIKCHDRQSSPNTAVKWYHSHCVAKGVGRHVCEQNIPEFVRRQQSNLEERERKVAKTLVIITTSYLLFWSPFFIIYTLYLREEFLSSSPFLLYEICLWLGLSNSAMNPIIYAYFVPTFRSAFKKILFRK